MLRFRTKIPTYIQICVIFRKNSKAASLFLLETRIKQDFPLQARIFYDFIPNPTATKVGDKNHLYSINIFLPNTLHDFWMYHNLDNLFQSPVLLGKMTVFAYLVIFITLPTILSGKHGSNNIV